MAEINIEKKNAVWPWILAAIMVLVLIWLLIKAFDVGVDTAATPATAPATTADTAAGSNVPAMGTAATAEGATPTGTNLERYAGMYGSSNMQLALDADGTYSMQESPAGEGRGIWTHDASSNAVHLTPADGTQDRYFRVEGNDTLVPLDADGEPAGQMAQLTRQAEE